MIEAARLVEGALLVAQVDNGIEIGPGLAGGAVGAFLTTLIVGGIMIAIAPQYTERTIESVADDPVGAMVYGLVVLVALVLLAIFLVITIIGIVVVIPLVLAIALMWAVGSAVGYLAIAERLIGRRDGWLKPLLLAAGINGALALTGIGGLIAFAVGAAGFGAILRDVLD